MSSSYVATRDIPLDELTPFPGNAKRGDVESIRASLRKNGQYRGLVVRDLDGAYIVLAGNHTMQALKAEGRETARCEVVQCDDATARRINLADNRTAEIGSYDDQALADLLRAAQVDDGDLLGTGWTDADLDALLASPSTEELDPVLPDEDDGPSEPPSEPVTRPGDVWILGQHRIICGDCRDYDTVTRLLDGRRINIAFTSPPYASQRTYDESSGFKPIPPDEYTDWFEDVQANVRAHLADDGSWFVNIKEHTDDGRRHLYVKDLTIAHVRRWGWRFVDELVWDTGGFPGKFPDRFKNGWEPVFHFAPSAEWAKFNPYAVAHVSDGVRRYEPGRSFQMGGSGYAQGDKQPEKTDGLALPSNVIKVSSGGDGSHSAAFPVALPEWFIRAYTDQGDTVFDPFMGSGSTLLAAHRNQRTAYGSEISPAYCDVICRRFQDATGITPVLESTGQPHDFTPAEEAT